MRWLALIRRLVRTALDGGGYTLLLCYLCSNRKFYRYFILKCAKCGVDTNKVTSLFKLYTTGTRTSSPSPCPNVLTHSLNILTIPQSRPILFNLSRIPRFVERSHPLTRLAPRYSAPVSHPLRTFTVSIRSEVDEQRCRTCQ